MIATLPIGAALIWLVPGESRARWIALVTALLDLVLGIAVLAGFDSDRDGFQFVERVEWIASLNIHYHVGVDGLSVLFLPLTVLLFNAVLLASWNSVRTLPRLFYTLLLLLESATLGIFCALDTMLFFFFWELTLVPVFFLISLWGIGPHRRYAAVKYTLFMMAGGVPLLFGFLLLAVQAGGGASGIADGLVFDYPALLEHRLPRPVEGTVFFLLLLGFAVKAPLFPLHTWLPTVAMEGPVSVTAIMAGLKVGAYGMIRYVVPLAPQAAQEYHWLLAVLGVTALLYGALAALAQTNLRRMLAFASLSHVGLVVLGIASLNVYGVQGALFQLLNFSIVAGGIFLLAGFLHHRVGSTDVVGLGGVAGSMPLLAAFFLFFGLAGLGVPGTNGFPAEFLIIASTLATHTGAGLAALAVLVLGAGYLLTLYRQAFLGPVRHAVVEQAFDLRGRELLIVLTFAALTLLFGLRPDSVLNITRVAAGAWVEDLR
jgi:NADH-quinone oxidoreductase subunit M